ncbi:MotE family protein [Limoniibacter endophyticus]|uniref:Flagellar motility protein MotE (MotC chaperone) n=1 Tax=Limoniibacter endophyticus TaxID=1565040 RepID=A0A8J3GH61_9HYPH|nr:MotE family protein [Limoniibacter endophyticus]GHC64555.1 hypothetical protein GCM10010136_06600 [Limoniibacter endophyticus]
MNKKINMAVLGTALALALSPAAAQALIEETPVANALEQSEIDRFCGNIADAARDRRYALQEEELTKLRADIDSRIKLLEDRRAEYEQWLKRREVFLARAEQSVVGIYSRMRADAAAAKLTELPNELAAAILMQLKEQQAGQILSEMEAKAAARLTTVMASVASKKDPS